MMTTQNYIRNLTLAFALSAAPMYAEICQLNDSWQFAMGECAKVQSSSQWQSVSLPHTWNGLDGQDGGNDFHRGACTYTRVITPDRADKNKTIYLRFGASNYQTDLYVNGKHAGSHIGGYTAFAFDITPYLQFGKPNELRVVVSNAEGLAVAPVSADFTFFGGLIRGVELVKKNKLHIAADDFGSRGVYVSQANVSNQEATLPVTVKLRNTDSGIRKGIVEISLLDHNNNEVAQTSSPIKVNKGEKEVSCQTINVQNPHLWNGRKDPYLYTVKVTLRDGKTVCDSYSTKIGLRYYSIDPNKGFMLNGESYPLRGVSLHEERPNKGNAVTDQERREDIDRLVDMGANYIRLSHYQHGDFTYNYLDSLGIVCWTETPVINHIKNTEEFALNTENCLRSLIRQQYNHPSIVVWGVTNEINYKKGPDPIGLVKRLASVVQQEDSTRLSTLAAMFSERKTNFITDVYSNNRYDGWYYNEISDIASFSDNLHAKYPERCIGISEYGAGAHPYHHQEGIGKPDRDGHWHPEGYQTAFHEGYLDAINSRPYLWSTSVWAAYDFASDTRNEGAQPGINDKGLITHDRKIKKDAYFFYKANWNPEPMVHICESRFSRRTCPQTEVKLYSNCKKVTLKVNGEAVEVQSDKNCIYRAPKVTLKPGANNIEASVETDGKNISHQAIWYYIPEANLESYNL